jgi:hypothetical protein
MQKVVKNDAKTVKNVQNDAKIVQTLRSKNCAKNCAKSGAKRPILMIFCEFSASKQSAAAIFASQTHENAYFHT